MIGLTLDVRAFEQKAKEIGGAIDQMPFALANTLNEAAFAARRVLTESTWPRHVDVKKRSFLTAALRVEKASKRNLTVAVVDTLGRAHLQMHARGGVKRAKSGNLAIPTKNVRRTFSGVADGQRPANLKRAIRKGNFLFQATGKGKNSRLRLMYKLQPSARIKKDVPFYEDFTIAMRNAARTAFPAAMAKAMRTRR